MRHFLMTAYDFLLVAIGLLYWAIVGFSITLISSLLHLIVPKKNSRILGRFLLQKAFSVFIYFLKITRFVIIDDRALTTLSHYQGAMIIAPNHIALWDAVFIIAKIPETICIMKGSILRNPILGGGARLAGYIPNDSTRQMLREASKQLTQGEKLLLFPEGTRTKKDAQWINPFQGAIAVIAKRSQAPVFPVYFRSDNRFFEKNNSLLNKPKFPLHLSIEVGKPLYFSDEDNVKDFTLALQQCYIEALSKSHPLRRKPSTGL